MAGTGVPKDTEDNAADFTVGAPGPENITSPINRNAQIKASLLDPLVPSTSAPNRVRDPTPDQANFAPFGTLAIRRTFTNQTGAPVTRLRFRIVDITTFPSDPGTADVRGRSSPQITIPTSQGNKLVQGLTVEFPGVDLNAVNNSSLSVDTLTLAQPLAPGASVNVQFLLNVQQTGVFRFFVNVEALTDADTGSNQPGKLGALKTRTVLRKH